MKITNKSSHFLLKLKFLVIFAVSGRLEGEVDPRLLSSVEAPVASTRFSDQKELSAGKV